VEELKARRREVRYPWKQFDRPWPVSGVRTAALEFPLWRCVFSGLSVFAL